MAEVACNPSEEKAFMVLFDSALIDAAHAMSSSVLSVPCAL